RRLWTSRRRRESRSIRWATRDRHVARAPGHELLKWQRARAAHKPGRPSPGVQYFHRLVGEPALTKEIGHRPHGEVDVCEKGFVAGAQVVQAAFAVRRVYEPVLGTFAVTCKAHRTFAAIARQRVTFGEPELPLLVRCHQRQHM